MRQYQTRIPCVFQNVLAAVVFLAAFRPASAIDFPYVTPPRYGTFSIGNVTPLDMDDNGDVLISTSGYNTSGVELWSAGGTYNLPDETVWGWQMLAANGTALGFYYNYDTYDYGFVSWTVGDGANYTSFYDLAADYVPGNITEVGVNPDYAYSTREGVYVAMWVVTHTHVLYDADDNDVGYDNDYWMMLRFNPDGTVSKLGDTVVLGGAGSGGGAVSISYPVATDDSGDHLTRNWTGNYTSEEDALYYVSGYDLDDEPIISEYDYANTMLADWGEGNLTLTAGALPTAPVLVPQPDDGYPSTGPDAPFTLPDDFVIYDGLGFRNHCILIDVDGTPVAINPFYYQNDITYLTITDGNLDTGNLTDGDSALSVVALNSSGMALTESGGLWLNGVELDTPTVAHLSGVNMFAISQPDDDDTALLVPSTVFGLESGSLGPAVQFWLNDDPVGGGNSTLRYADGVVDGTTDLNNFFPVSCDLQQLLAALPPSDSVKYYLSQADGAVNFVYSNLTADEAYSYLDGNLTTGFGPDFDQAAANATTTQITADGIELSADFLANIQNYNEGVLLLEGRIDSTAPLVLTVQQDDETVVQLTLPLSLGPRILLLLHGMNSNVFTWNDFVNSNFGNTTANVTDIVNESISSTPTLTTNGVRCYRLQFGFYDPSSSRIGLEGITANNTVGYFSGNSTSYLGNNTVRCGDFETFDQLGQEVDDAITLLLSEHWNAQIILVGHNRGGLAARDFLENSDFADEQAAVVALLTTVRPI